MSSLAKLDGNKKVPPICKQDPQTPGTLLEGLHLGVAPGDDEGWALQGRDAVLEMEGLLGDELNLVKRVGEGSQAFEG